MLQVTKSAGSWVVARNSAGAWYVYQSTFAVAAYAGRTDCLACATRGEAADVAYDLWLLGA